MIEPLIFLKAACFSYRSGTDTEKNHLISQFTKYPAENTGYNKMFQIRRRIDDYINRESHR